MNGHLCLAVVLSMAMLGCAVDPAERSRDAGETAATDAEPRSDVDAGEESNPTPVACREPNGEVQNASCNDLTATGPCLQELQIDDSSTAPAGGALVEGSYDLTDLSLYTNPAGAAGPVGEPRRETIVLTGAESTWVMNTVTVSGAVASRMTLALRSAGARVEVTATCPSSQADGGSPVTIVYYTASGDSLTLYRLSPNGPVEASTYTRR